MVQHPEGVQAFPNSPPPLPLNGGETVSDQESHRRYLLCLVLALAVSGVVVVFMLFSPFPLLPTLSIFTICFGFRAIVPMSPGLLFPGFQSHLNLPCQEKVGHSSQNRWRGGHRRQLWLSRTSGVTGVLLGEGSVQE